MRAVQVPGLTQPSTWLRIHHVVTALPLTVWVVYMITLPVLDVFFSLSGLSKTVHKGHTALFPLLLPFPFFVMLDFLVDSRISFIWRVKVYSGCSGGVDSFNGWSILL